MLKKRRSEKKQDGQIREKARKLVNYKMQTKLKDFEVSENLIYELEAVFLEDLEETIQEHLKAYKDTLKHEHHQSEDDQMLLYCWEMFQLYASFMNNQFLISE
jgi:uncharacterized membrane protein YcgQ (UPF0703/DUF1980 family)